MNRSTARWVLLCLALLLTASASYFEWQAVVAGFTAGDVAGPPDDQQQMKQAIRELEHRANFDYAVAVACLILASLCLGTALRRKNWKYTIAIYIGAFVICPIVSFLPIYIVVRLHMS